MTRFLNDEPHPVLTLRSRIGWVIYYSEIIFDDPPYLILQAMPDFPGGNSDLAERGIVWDVFSLIDSIKHPGAHQALTSDCGYAPDSSLEESILVSHPDTGTVVWELDIPGLRPALDKTLVDASEGFVRLVFACDRYEADIRELVRALQQAGRDPVAATALDSRTYGLKHLLADYPACDSLPVDALEPGIKGMELERVLELDADEPWQRTPLWPVGTLIEFGFFLRGDGHALMHVNGKLPDCLWPRHYFTRWEVMVAFNTWLSYTSRAFALKSKTSIGGNELILLRNGSATNDNRRTETGIGRNEFVLLRASDRRRCHEAGRRFAAVFQASLQEGETAPGVMARYCENPLHAADDEQFPAEGDAVD